MVSPLLQCLLFGKQYPLIINNRKDRLVEWPRDDSPPACNRAEFNDCIINTVILTYNRYLNSLLGNAYKTTQADISHAYALLVSVLERTRAYQSTCQYSERNISRRWGRNLENLWLLNMTGNRWTEDKKSFFSEQLRP